MVPENTTPRRNADNAMTWESLCPQNSQKLLCSGGKLIRTTRGEGIAVRSVGVVEPLLVPLGVVMAMEKMELRNVRTTN
jgi:hypothetical protein